MPGSWTHLAARFFDVLTAQPLRPEERVRLDEWLSPVEQAIFLGQSAADQRHGLECGIEVATSYAHRPDLVRAALLHDVGKRHARLGPFGRVLASVLIRLRIPVGARFRSYEAHGPIGSNELLELGAERIVVDFARHHHGTRPDSITDDDWDLLESVDRARVGAARPSSGYADPAHGNGRRR
ncbi:MAG: hypothetical protein ACFCVC_11770 [Acidimicrobiia bacterium]